MAIIKMPVSRRRMAKGEEGSNPKRTTSGEASIKKRDACILCDDGGDLIICDGGCRRSFHPTKQHGKRSMCATLGLTREQWQEHVALGDAALYTCKNCKYRQHQCFSCGLLGSSDLTSSGGGRPEVFQCKHQRCGHFYHPSCVAKLLHPDRRDDRAVLREYIAAGLEFHCPMHQCKSCKGAENRDDEEMRFAVCRRCPTAYHRKCLPTDISFKEFKQTGKPRRAWGKILLKQILIYCMKHEIQEELGTPMRDHIVFPDGRNAFAAKRARGTPQEHDIFKEEEEQEELLDWTAEAGHGGHFHRGTRPSQSPQPAEAGHGGHFHHVTRPSQSPHPAETSRDRVKPIDSFAPKHLFSRPQTGSCGWLDE